FLVLRSTTPAASSISTLSLHDALPILLWEINDPSGGKRTVVSLRDMSPDLVKATLAAEDAHFYEHPGFDPGATLRSAWVDVTQQDRKSTRLNSSHRTISYAVFCLKKKK